jgi:hypothetical protein
MSSDDLPADVLAEIEADVARYRNGRIRAARRRLTKAKTPAFVDVTFAELADIARRWLRRESLRAIARSLDWDPVSISSALDAFTVVFRPDFDFDRGPARRNEVEAALAKFDGGEPPRRQPRIRRFSPSHLEQRRATRRATERGSP